MMTNGNQKNMMANGLMNGNQKNMMANGLTTIGNMMVNGMTTIGNQSMSYAKDYLKTITVMVMEIAITNQIGVHAKKLKHYVMLDGITNGLTNGNQKNMMVNGLIMVNGMKTGNQKNMMANGLTKTGSQKKIMKDQCAIVMTNVKSTTIAASMKTNVQKNMTII